MTTQRTLILCKPDAYQRGLVGEIVSRFERVGATIVAMKLLLPDFDQATEHYKDLDAKYGDGTTVKVAKSLLRGRVVAMVIVGDDIVEVARKLVGGTEPKSAAPGTIRGDFAHVSMRMLNGRNLVHASADPEQAEREISIWFKSDEFPDIERRRIDDF